MDGLVSRFLSFDKLIGTSLIKFVYYVGLVLVVVGSIFAALGSLGAIGVAPLRAIGGFIIALVAGGLGLIFWRFICELYMLFFRMSDDIHELKATMAGGGKDAA